MAILMVMVVGLIEVAFALYGRNVVAASAHEGARAAIELGRSRTEAVAVARQTVKGSAGGLIDNLKVGVSVQRLFERSIIHVRVSGVLKSFGPVPMPIPVTTTATSTREIPSP